MDIQGCKITGDFFYPFVRSFHETFDSSEHSDQMAGLSLGQSGGNRDFSAVKHPDLFFSGRCTPPAGAEFDQRQ